jgi:hypothetical protein
VQSPVTNLESSNRRLLVAVVTVVNQLLEDVVGEQCQDRVGSFLDFIPDDQALVGFE